MKQRVQVSVVVACVLWCCLGAPTGASPRQSVGEHIATFDSAVTARTDGSADVVETIAYDFGDTAHHGIDRLIPVSFPWTGATPHKGSFRRVTPISGVSVTATGASAQTETSESNGVYKIRVGDPNVTITGQHTYVIRYHLAGLINGFSDHDELNFNLTGNEWTVPIDSATGSVTMPAAITQFACFQGYRESQLPCATANADGATARFAQTSLSTGEGITAVVAIPSGTITKAGRTPILEETWSLRRAFTVNPATVGGGGVLLLAGVGGIVLLLSRVGRDRRYAGSAVDAAFGNATGDEAPVPLRDREQHPVEFVPPDGIRPGHMGTLWDEVANPLDVSAMIIDLAVRGYMRIEEVEAPGSGGVMGFGRSEGNYNFVRLREADDTLLSAESLLLQSIFRDGGQVQLSEMKQHFASRLALVESALYDDSVQLGWFPTRPDRVRSHWHAIGLAAFLLASGIAYLAIRYTTFGLVALPLPFAGLLLLALSGRFPHRTAKGSALLGRVKGFKELFDAGEGERQRFAESKQLFSQYLPYAIVFGMAEKWAVTFQALGLTPQEMGLGTWYFSPYGYNPITFGYAMSSFSTVTTGSIAAAAPSSSGASGFSGGGFSGGGFGGGGGGSW